MTKDIRVFTFEFGSAKYLLNVSLTQVASSVLCKEKFKQLPQWKRCWNKKDLEPHMTFDYVQPRHEETKKLKVVKVLMIDIS